MGSWRCKCSLPSGNGKEISFWNLFFWGKGLFRTPNSSGLAQFLYQIQMRGGGFPWVVVLWTVMTWSRLQWHRTLISSFFHNCWVLISSPPKKRPQVVHFPFPPPLRNHRSWTLCSSYHLPPLYLQLRKKKDCWIPSVLESRARLLAFLIHRFDWFLCSLRIPMRRERNLIFFGANSLS